jgi:hypothetical protein
MKKESRKLKNGGKQWVGQDKKNAAKTVLKHLYPGQVVAGSNFGVSTCLKKGCSRESIHKLKSLQIEFLFEPD